jgi:hypothetical protein
VRDTSFELGRIFGIRIGVNWSWLVVFGLILWTLASGIFPATNSGLSDGTYLAMAIAASLLCGRLLASPGAQRRNDLGCQALSLLVSGRSRRCRASLRMMPTLGGTARLLPCV